jgi:hypothetical protein
MAIAAGLELKVIGNDCSINVSTGIKIDIIVRSIDDSDPFTLGFDVKVILLRSLLR